MAGRILTSQLTGTLHTFPISVALPSDAYAFGATRLVQGYYDGPASFHVSVEDTATRKMVVQEDLKAPALEAIGKVALLLDPQAHPFTTQNQQSLEAWAGGNPKQAVALDPGFTAGWIALVEQVAARNKQEAAEIADRALALQPPLKDGAERAQLEVMAATLKDDVQSRGAALDKLAHLVPLDAGLWRTLAEVSMTGRNFSKAAEAYRETVKLNPADAAMKNMLGYAEAYSGDLLRARGTLTQYGMMAGQASNSMDSAGEISFLSGKFADAEQAFLEGYKKDPNFIGGADLGKAAYARWFGGNHDGADQLMRDFLIARVKQKDPNTAWREAVWLYSTSRIPQARATLEKALTSGDLAPEAQILVRKQIAVWESPALPHDVTQLKTLYQHTDPAQDGLIRTFYAAALLRTGKKDEARQLVLLWPLPEAGGDPLYQAFLYPKFLGVRSAVGL